MEYLKRAVTGDQELRDYFCFLSKWREVMSSTWQGKKHDHMNIGEHPTPNPPKTHRSSHLLTLGWRCAGCFYKQQMRPVCEDSCQLGMEDATLSIKPLPSIQNQDLGKDWTLEYFLDYTPFDVNQLVQIWFCK